MPTFTFKTQEYVTKIYSVELDSVDDIDKFCKGELIKEVISEELVCQDIQNFKILAIEED